MLGVSTGGRISELLSLRIGDVYQNEGFFMVYFVQDMRRHRIKIGYTESMANRLQTLRSEFGFVRVLATTQGMREREQELHRQFHEDRIDGEWFRMSDAICCFVSRLNRKLLLRSDSDNLWQAGERKKKKTRKIKVFRL